MIFASWPDSACCQRHIRSCQGHELDGGMWRIQRASILLPCAEPQMAKSQRWSKFKTQELEWVIQTVPKPCPLGPPIGSVIRGCISWQTSCFKDLSSSHQSRGWTFWQSNMARSINQFFAGKSSIEVGEIFREYLAVSWNGLSLDLGYSHSNSNS